MSDLQKTLAILRTVEGIVALANNSPYYYHRYYHYYPPRPVVVIERPMVVETQTIIETPVVVETQVTVTDSDNPVGYEGLPVDGEGLYSIKMGASFRLERIQIPGYRLTAALLTSDPVEGSPLDIIGLRKGDVITRLGRTPVNTLDVLEQHERGTEIRYIKANTTRVRLNRIYIPTDEEIFGDEVDYAP